MKTHDKLKKIIAKYKNLNLKITAFLLVLRENYKTFFFQLNFEQFLFKKFFFTTNFFALTIILKLKKKSWSN